MMGRGSTVPFLANATSVNNTGLVQVLFFLCYLLVSGHFFLQVRQLNATISDKKSSLAPIIKELRPMRQKCQVLSSRFLLSFPFYVRCSCYISLRFNLFFNICR